MRRRELLVGALALACAEPARPNDPSVPITPIALGAPRLARADGTTLELARWRGRPFLLHFWASWCTPCVRELPALLANDRVLAVSRDGSWDEVRAFFGGAVPDRVVREPEAELAMRLGVGALPDTYVIDGALHAHRRVRGARDWREPALARWLTRTTD